MVHSIPSTVFLLSSLRYIVLAQNCYFPNGDLASAYTPCASNTGQCCYNIDANHTDLCYNNGLCYSWFFGTVYRGACTDRTWKASGCASLCLETMTDDATKITPCEDRTYCCGRHDEASSCCSSSAGFPWNNATFINYAPTSAQPASASRIATSSLPSTMQTTSNDATATSCPTGHSSATQKSSTPSFGAGLGIGIAIGVCAVTVTSLVWWLCARRKGVESAGVGQAQMLAEGKQWQGVGAGGQHHGSASGIQHQGPPLEMENSYRRELPT